MDNIPNRKLCPMDLDVEKLQCLVSSQVIKEKSLIALIEVIGHACYISKQH